jgi:hypothetical protein
MYAGFPPLVAIDWETTSEVDTVAFMLYRSESAGGPFSPLTERPLPARGDPLAGAAYRYEDREVAWGRRYFYRLAELDRSGAHELDPGLVDARAGAGWPFALATGALLSTLGELACRVWARERAPRAGGDG